MKTEALIQRLAADATAVPRGAVRQRLLIGTVAGATATLILVAALLGIRADLVDAMHGFPFWMKLAYTISIGVGASAMVARLARPQRARLQSFWPVAIPALLLALVGMIEMANVPAADWLALGLGKTWKKCPWIILAFAAPIFVGLLWSFRNLAPTQLRAAGAAAGLASGAWAAALYCLHCPEVSAIFVLTWYTLGIVLAAAAGAALGPRVLRW